MGSIFKPKIKNQQDLTRQKNEQAAAAEKERLAREEEAKKAQSELERSKQIEAEEAKRRAFVGQLQEQGQEPTRRRFLKAI